MAQNKADTEMIDWERRRYDIAKDVITAIMGRTNYDPFMASILSNHYTSIANLSVRVADALITELKKTENDDKRAD